MKKTQPKKDYFQETTDKLLLLLEKGAKPWEKPWTSVPFQNPISGTIYKGINPLLCGIDSLAKGYGSPYFLTFDQASQNGWKIKKGSKGTPLRWGGIVSKEVESEDGGTKKESFNTCKWYILFNMDCVDDSESEKKISDVVKPVIKEAVTEHSLSDFIKATGASVNHGGSEAFYSPTLDRINLPHPSDFNTQDGYNATLLHEIAHWTGHESRCARDLSGKFGSKKYAAEELVAEIASAMLCDRFGFSSELENHASYLSHWMTLLKEDSKAFFNAASKATKASTYLLELAGEV